MSNVIRYKKYSILPLFLGVLILFMYKYVFINLLTDLQLRSLQQEELHSRALEQRRTYLEQSTGAAGLAGSLDAELGLSGLRGVPITDSTPLSSSDSCNLMHQRHTIDCVLIIVTTRWKRSVFCFEIGNKHTPNWLVVTTS